jgi:hypothetical protein
LRPRVADGRNPTKLCSIRLAGISVELLVQPLLEITAVGHTQGLVVLGVRLQLGAQIGHFGAGLHQRLALPVHFQVQAPGGVKQGAQAQFGHAGVVFVGIGGGLARFNLAALARHRRVHPQNVQADPGHQKTHHAPGQIGPAVARVPQLAQVDDELLVLAAVQHLVPLVQAQALHEGFFVGKLGAGVGHQAVKGSAQRHLAPVGRQGAVEQGGVQSVEQVDQRAVLVVQGGHAGAEVAVPGEELHVRGRAVGGR